MVNGSGSVKMDVARVVETVCAGIGRSCMHQSWLELDMPELVGVASSHVIVHCFPLQHYNSDGRERGVVINIVIRHLLMCTQYLLQYRLV